MAPNFEHLQRIEPYLMPLLATQGGKHLRVDGTAFLIGPGWAMTATHVLLEYLATIDQAHVNLHLRDGAHRHLSPTFDLAVGILGPPPTVTTVHAIHSYFAFPGDICVLRLKDAQFDWTQLVDYPRLKLLPPTIGSAITALGFPNTVADTIVPAPTMLTLNRSFSVGKVVELHDLKRDNFSLDFPCYRTTANLIGGMSGGPVLDEEGVVCGIVSTSYDLPVGEEPISYMLTLWQAATINIVEPPSVDLRPFLELLRSGSFSVQDEARVRLEVNHDRTFNVKILPAAPG